MRADSALASLLRSLASFGIGEDPK
jgi:hypothetical protein